MARMGRALLLAALMVVVASMTCSGVDATKKLKNGLKKDFYNKTCPNVEDIVFNVMEGFYKNNKTVAPGILRIQFHDCFVRGCDASLLLDGNGSNAEKDSAINANLHGFDYLDEAKAAVEKECPGVVSCADILAFSSRDSIVLTGGKGWKVPAGRRDGTVSNVSEPILNIPSSEMNVSQIQVFFQRHNISDEQLVTLSGAHTIGISHCFFIQGRLFAYPSASHIDPTLPAGFLKSLQNQCPVNVTTPYAVGENHALNMDRTTPGTFDTNYFKQLVSETGLMTSDQSLYRDKRTRKYVLENVDFSKFNARFAKAMIKLTSVDVKTGTEGQIRKHCRFVN